MGNSVLQGMKRLITVVLMMVSSGALANEANLLVDAQNGFTYKGKVINPKCVQLLQPSVSENTAIITRSIVIDTCQNSNLAFEGLNYSINAMGGVEYIEDINDPHTRFSYQVLGKLSTNVYALYHLGTVGIYSYEKESVLFDFTTNERQSVYILTKLSESFMPCFKAGNIAGGYLKITKSKWDSNAPKANQCLDSDEALSFNLSDILNKP
ncbi:hypothetical protein [Photobacterium sanguinicancri]|uniref:hypothetical protein n=1 Tax=Photobacterium sanguinicancri TaxID=875932 RepID=UPI0026E2D20B|nr:hypothetical protein [Photobacterium sanguinicancri]MDO6496928.1 hypothetical protein [Photobacterium sanguinicancri]